MCAWPQGRRWSELPSVRPMRQPLQGLEGEGDQATGEGGAASAAQQAQGDHRGAWDHGADGRDGAGCGAAGLRLPIARATVSTIQAPSDGTSWSQGLPRLRLLRIRGRGAAIAPPPLAVLPAGWRWLPG